MIFAKVNVDSVAQVDDRIRIDLESAHAHGEEFTEILVSPDTEFEPIIVVSPELGKDSYFLDWQYGTPGTKTISVEFKTPSETKVVNKSIKVLTANEERLFSTDEMLLERETTLLNLLPKGRSSFIYAHRLAQREILRELAERGINVTAEQVFDIVDVQNWSIFTTLRNIFEANITNVQDVHILKRNTYRDLQTLSMNKAIVRLDMNKDGKPDVKVNTFPTSLVRR